MVYCWLVENRVSRRLCGRVKVYINSDFLRLETQLQREKIEWINDVRSGSSHFVDRFVMRGTLYERVNRSDCDVLCCAAVSRISVCKKMSFGLFFLLSRCQYTIHIQQYKACRML